MLAPALERDVGVDRPRIGGGRCRGAPELAHDDSGTGPAGLDDRQVGGGDMLERGVHFLIGFGQREPGLDAGKLGADRAFGRRRALRMDDAAARGHQIDRAGLDRREGADRIAMVDRTGIEIGHRGEIDVRVRPHVDAGADIEPRRAHLVEEDEGTHHRPRT